MNRTVYIARRSAVLIGVFALVLCVLAMTGNRPGAVFLAIVAFITFGVVFAFAERAAA